MAKVALLGCADYEIAAIEEKLAGLDMLTDFPDVKGKRVLLKPNLLSPSEPDKAVTTHPELMRGVIRLLKRKEAGEIVAGDGPAVGAAVMTAKRAGLYQVCEEENVTWVNFNQTSAQGSDEARIHKQFLLTREAEKADVIISLPKLKTHGMMYFTGAMKNLFGLLPGLDKSGFHLRYPERYQFATMIADLNLTVKADYAIMDGITAMEGRGPGNGDPRHLGVILASSDLLALDIAASNLIGYDGPSLPIHKAMLETSLWINNPDELELTGDDETEFACPHFHKISIVKEDTTGLVNRRFHPLLKGILVPRPVFQHRDCIRCGKCLAICPPKALSFTGEGKKKKVSIDYGKCIRCYCCDEICPADAIRLKRRF